MRNLLSVSAKIVSSLLIMFGLSVLLQWAVAELDDSGYSISIIVINFSFSVIIFFLVQLFNKKYNQLHASDYGFDLTKFFKKFLAGVLSVVLIIGFILLIAGLLDVTVIFTGLQKNGAILLLQIIAANLAVGAWEEMYFRGLLFNTLLKGKSRFHLAAFITTILFTVLHAGSF